MNWKEILKVSTIIAVAIVILGWVVDLIGPVKSLETQLYVGLLVGGLIATYSILNKRLKKDDWGVVVGILTTFVIYAVLLVLLSLIGL